MNDHIFLELRERFRKRLAGKFVRSKIWIMDLYCRIKKTDSRIKDLENKYNGKRCFIIATGPSLTLEDVDMVKNEITFSMNSCIKLFDKTDWRPDFYFMFDPEVYRLLKQQIEEADLKTVIFNKFSIPYFCREAIPHKVNSKCLTYISSDLFTKRPKMMQFSKRAGSFVYEGHSTVYGILQMAAYMGFSEIYLLGCDCNYQKESHSKLTQYDIQTPKNMGEWMIRDYIDAKQSLNEMGVKVYNATRGGMLEVFPRVALESIFSEKAQK